jgi:phage terminase large subunit-like protein
VKPGSLWPRYSPSARVSGLPAGSRHGRVTATAGQLTHSGDSRLARHVGNAVLREDARGARLAKERRDLPRMIDAAVAAVMAHHRAAVLAGDRGPSIYV